MNKIEEEKRLLFIIRGITLFYIFVLIFWAIAAFPIQTELEVASQALGISPESEPGSYDFFREWIATLTEGVAVTNQSYPFISAATDWLAFFYLLAAVAFIGVYVKPVRNIWIVYLAMIACLSVLPVAMISGAVRAVPFWWRIMTSAFSLVGLVPLFLLHIYIERLAALTDSKESKY